jgi:outer membrane protease
MRSLILGMGIAALLYSGASAEDLLVQSPDGMVIWYGGLGLTGIKAHEYVFSGDRKVSELIWRSAFVPTATAGLTAELPQKWYIHTDVAIGYGGNGYMADFDWLVKGRSWSDRSLSPDTRLDHYFTGSLEAGRELITLQDTTISLGAGVKYTDVQWSAFGGSFIYTNQSWHDWRGHFPSGEKGITFRQAMPVPYLGLNFSHTTGAWTLAGSLQGGVSVSARDIDDHWLRDLRFYDYYQTAPDLSARLSADYAWRNNLSLYLSGGFDRLFLARADTKIVKTTTGRSNWDPNSAGGDYSSVTVSFGIKGKF